MATLSKGSSGDNVRTLQSKLNSAGPFPPMEDLVVDGIYGPLTEATVVVYQATVGISPANGVAGPETLARLGVVVPSPSGGEVFTPPPSGGSKTPLILGGLVLGALVAKWKKWI